MRRIYKKATVFVLTLILACMPTAAFAAGSNGTEAGGTAISAAVSEKAIGEAELSALIGKTAEYLVRTVSNPVISMTGGEWAVLGLARSDADVPQSYYDKYYQNAAAELKAKEGKLSSVKYSEYSRVILALTAIGRDVTDVEGYNLLEKLADYNSVIKQGINGPIFALIALDSRDYPIPQVSGVPVQTTREMLLGYILDREITDAKGVKGGFALSGDVPEADITGMALQALANYEDRPDVKAAADRALIALDRLQQANGGFSAMETENSESIVQAIVAKSALGIDAGRNVAALMEYCMDDGSVQHVLNRGANLMASEQGLYALVSYARYKQGLPSLYDMSDAASVSGAAPGTGSGAGANAGTGAGSGTGVDSGAGTSADSGGIKVSLNGQYLEFEQAPVNIEGNVLVPMSVIFRAMGAEVIWDGTAKKVTGTLGGKTVELMIGSSIAAVNGAEVTLAVPARIINGYTMVPARFITESLGAQVSWQGDTNTVVITH
jgi:hypothetical protein